MIQLEKGGTISLLLIWGIRTMTAIKTPEEIDKLFRNSHTYKEMKLRIEWLESLDALNQTNIAKAKKNEYLESITYKQVLEDNKRIISNLSNIEYFAGITENWRAAREYNDLLERIQTYRGKIDQLEQSIAQRDEQIINLQEELANAQVNAEPVHNARGAGRKKKDFLNTDRYLKVCNMLSEGKSVKSILSETKISKSTFYRYKEEYENTLKN